MKRIRASLLPVACCLFLTALVQLLSGCAGRSEVASESNAVFGDDRTLKRVEASIEALGAENHRYDRERAAERLGEFGHRKAVEPLIAALSDPDIQVRRETARALGKIGDVRAEAPLVEALNGPDPWRARVPIVIALASLGTPTAMESVVASLRDEDARVRHAAASTLTGKGWEPEGVRQTLWQRAASRDWDGLGERYAAFEQGRVSSTANSIEAPFRLDLPIPAKLTGQVEHYGRTDNVLTSYWIAFHEDEGRLRARMYLREVTNASRDWLLTVRVFDDAGHMLDKSQALVSTVLLASGGAFERDHDVMFTFDAPFKVSAAARFFFTLEESTDGPQEPHTASNTA